MKRKAKTRYSRFSCVSTECLSDESYAEICRREPPLLTAQGHIDSYCMLALSGVGWDHTHCTMWLVKLHSFNKLSPYNVLNTVNNDLCSCFLLSHILCFMLPILYQNRRHMEAKLNLQTELILCAVTI